ncbi:SDR family NAD(P)-dependent oxidoreductase [Acinetobacter puyangensis]|uniref:Short-chain dehydrogenase n=1 Tax=Acinetobacter puyangensis TaxID=1096779 RepID=A0A240EDY6_9GAMM|nr:SDR family NAD(P)-dependent oxidoreductase [Acinetobacter puyangensis]SNX46120.1 Short-chain dehydrogenase [Acinetobacter puyangensis]
MKKKTVLITGASSGLGEAFAKYCAKQGCHLALVARRLERLEQLAEQLREQYAVQVEVAQLDVTEHDKILPIFIGLSDLLGQIDIVVINAGISKVRHLGDDRLDKDIEVLNTNLIAAIACSDAAQKMFRIQGQPGHIVAISSYSAFIGLPQAAAYSASKAALATYFNAIRTGLSKRGIAVTVVYPGFVQTELLHGFNPQLPIVAQPEAVAQQIYTAIIKQKAEAIVPPLPWKVLYGLQQVTPKPVLRWITQLL